MRALLFRCLDLLKPRFEVMLPAECRVRAERDCGIYWELIVTGPDFPEVEPGARPPDGGMIITVTGLPASLTLEATLYCGNNLLRPKQRLGPFASFEALADFMNAIPRPPS